MNSTANVWRKTMRSMSERENMGGKKLEGELQDKGSDINAGQFIRIPFQIEDELTVRSLAVAAHRTKSRIVGSVPGDFILIKEPVVVINERIMAIFDNVFEVCLV